MRPGEVVQIRVNPTDCMAVVDLIDATGTYQAGMSFSSAVSAALASAFQTLRDGGLLPERAGFEYNEMMQKFPKMRNARKLAIANSLHSSSDIVRPALQLATVAPEPVEATPNPLSATIDMQVKRDRLQVLYERKELGVVLSVEELEEFNSLMKLIYG